MSTLSSTTHPVGRYAAAEGVRLGEMGRTSMLGLSASDAGEVLRDFDAVIAQLEALRLRVLAHADVVGTHLTDGSPTMTAWLSHHARLDHRHARELVRLAGALEDRPATATAMAEGRIHQRQVTEIVTAVQALPADRIPTETIDLAEQTLLEHAQDPVTGRPNQLRILGRRILDVVAPELGEAEEARLLDLEERHATQRCRLTMVDDGHGATHGRFTLPTTCAHALRKALTALMAPQHCNATGGPGTAQTVWAKPGPERLGEALRELIERYPTDQLPHAGGLNATLIVTIDLDTLRGDLDKIALTDTGHRISATEARRMACEAGILPAVCNGRSEPLDLGRTRRFHTRTQRYALTLRDRGCRAEGCDKPPALCHAHHLDPWAKGGTTTLTRTVLLCAHHHRRAHDTSYATETRPDGRIAFHRRP